MGLIIIAGIITIVLGLAYTYKVALPETYINYGGKWLDYGFYIPKTINWVVTIGHHDGGNSSG